MAEEGSGKRLSWVKGHDGTKGNEEADYKARETAWVGSMMHKPDTPTPAGIRQAFPLYHTQKCKKWKNHEVKGLTYVYTHRGPQYEWKHRIGQANSTACPCGAPVQSATHILVCPRFQGTGRLEMKDI